MIRNIGQKMRGHTNRISSATQRQSLPRPRSATGRFAHNRNPLSKEIYDDRDEAAEGCGTLP